jgi:hypothetical protein
VEPIGLLMREHRLSEHRMEQVEAEFGRINSNQRCESSFIDIAVG